MRFNLWFICFVTFIIILPLVKSSIINEIMYNPPLDNNYYEWVELYTTKQLNFSEILLSDSSSIDKIACCSFLKNCSLIVPENSYVLITDQDTKLYNITQIPEEAIKICVDDNSIGNGLGNNGDVINLTFKNGTFIDYFRYDGTLANGNNKTLAYTNGSWQESYEYGGTPGSENSKIQEKQLNKGLSIKLNLPYTLYSNILYDSIFRIENLDYPTITGVNITFYYNISNYSALIKEEVLNITDVNSYKTTGTGEFKLQEGYYKICGIIYNSTIENSLCADIVVLDSSTKTCNINLQITTAKDIYEEGEPIKFYNTLNNETFPFLIKYRIEDIFGNIIKDDYETSNTNQKQWTPDSGGNIFIIKSEISFLGCNDSSLGDNSAQKVVAVKIKGSIQNESFLAITDFDNASFGDIILTKIDAYRGDTQKYTLKIWIENENEKLTDVSKIHLKNKYTNYSFEIPLYIKEENCKKGGKYNLVAEGLGLIDRKEILIQDGPCAKKNSTSKNIISYSIIDFPTQIDLGKELSVKIQLFNNSTDIKTFEVWSYLYKQNSTSENKSNIQYFTLNPENSVIFELKNPVAKKGNYSLKVKIKSNKEVEEFSKEIFILTNSSRQETSFVNETESNLNSIKNSITGATVFSSTNLKAKNIAAYIFGIVAIFIIITLVIRHETNNRKNNFGISRISERAHTGNNEKFGSKDKRR